MKKIKNIKIVDPGSSPDIDTDFHSVGRLKTIDYVINKYGNDKVASIITPGPFKTKNAWKSMCTVMNIPFYQANKISQYISENTEGTLESYIEPTGINYKDGADLRLALSDNQQLKDIILDADKLKGRMRETGVHACGIIISSKAINDIVPMQIRQEDNLPITQWNYYTCEELGLLKADFLGLDTIDLIDNTIKFIKKNKDVDINLEEIIYGDLDDKEVYKLFQRAETIGIFQFAGAGVQEMLKSVQPDKFEDLAAITAIYRPGPMGLNLHLDYAERKNDPEKRIPVHKSFIGTKVESILEKTYGALVYQEQIMILSQECAGFNKKDADKLRKAIGKKKMDLMISLGDKFKNGMIKNGYDEQAVNELWDGIVGFGAYSFNKCLHYDTKVYLENGKSISIKNLYKMWETNKDIRILSMWEDGNIKPHKIKNIVSTGKKPCYQIVTKKGRKIKITEEHRMLTNFGYGTIKDGTLKVGVELLEDDYKQRISEDVKQQRKENWLKCVRSSNARNAAKKHMTEYQKTLSYEDRCKHQQKIQKNNPHRTDNFIKAGQEKLKKLRKDKNWIENVKKPSQKRNFEKRLKKGTIFGQKINHNGIVYDSILEYTVAQYLEKRGIHFEAHKKIKNPIKNDSRWCDFYVDGLYIEVDGLRRGRKYFEENKYGKEIPFIVVTQYDFIEKIDEALSIRHIYNGDEIVEINSPEEVWPHTHTNSTFDIEMELDGPCNFIANGLVSHNSHSVSYALNSYQSAYLKVHYPVEFMAAAIQQNMEKDDFAIYFAEAKRLNIEVKPPSINESYLEMYPSKNKREIFYGLSCIKRINNEIIKQIIEEREKNGLYKDINDFIKRNKTIIKVGTLKTLAQSGVLDCLNVSRKQVFENANDIIKQLSKVEKINQTNNFFSMMSNPIENSFLDLSDEEWNFPEYIKKEAEITGTYLSSHPIDNIQNKNELMLTSENLVGSVYLSFVSVKTKKNKYGETYTLVIADNKISQKEFRLYKNIQNRFLKWKALENSDGDIEEAAKQMNYINKMEEFNNIKPLKPLEEHIVYKVYFNTAIKKNKNGGLIYRPYIENIETVDLDDNGRILYKVNIQNKNNIKKIKKYLKEKPGKDTIRLLFNDDEFYDVKNIKFMPGTTQADIENIELS